MFPLTTRLVLTTAFLAVTSLASTCTVDATDIVGGIGCGCHSQQQRQLTSQCVSNALDQQQTDPRLPLLDKLRRCLLVEGGCAVEEVDSTLNNWALRFCNNIPDYNYPDSPPHDPIASPNPNPNDNGNHAVSSPSSQHQHHQNLDYETPVLDELRKRQKDDKTNSAAPTEVVGDKTTADPKQTDDAKTTAADDQTTVEPKTTEASAAATTDSPQTTDDAAATTTAPDDTSAAAATTSAPSSTSKHQPTTLSTPTTTPSSSSSSSSMATPAPATTGTNTPLVCLTTSHLSTTWCITATAAGQTGTTCVPTFTPVINCADGLICQTQAAGETSCMVRQDNLTTSGLIVTIVFGVMVIVFFAALGVMCVKSRRTSRQASRAAAAAHAASGMGGKRVGTGMRDVEATGAFGRGRQEAQRSEAHLPLMAAQGPGGGMGSGGHSRTVSADYNSVRPMAAQRTVSAGAAGGYRDMVESRTPSGMPPQPSLPVGYHHRGNSGVGSVGSIGSVGSVGSMGGGGFEEGAEEDDMGYRRGR